MQYIVDKIELEEDIIYLRDSMKEDPVKITEGSDGMDLLISTGDGLHIIVDSKMFIGSLKALTSIGERDRIRRKGRP